MHSSIIVLIIVKIPIALSCERHSDFCVAFVGPFDMQHFVTRMLSKCSPSVYKVCAL